MHILVSGPRALPRKGFGVIPRVQVSTKGTLKTLGSDFFKKLNKFGAAFNKNPVPLTCAALIKAALASDENIDNRATYIPPNAVASLCGKDKKPKVLQCEKLMRDARQLMNHFSMQAGWDASPPRLQALRLPHAQLGLQPTLRESSRSVRIVRASSQVCYTTIVGKVDTNCIEHLVKGSMTIGEVAQAGSLQRKSPKLHSRATHGSD